MIIELVKEIIVIVSFMMGLYFLILIIKIFKDKDWDKKRYKLIQKNKENELLVKWINNKL